MMISGYLFMLFKSLMDQKLGVDTSMYLAFTVEKNNYNINTENTSRVCE